MKLPIQYIQFLSCVLADNLANLLPKETFKALKN